MRSFKEKEANSPFHLQSKKSIRVAFQRIESYFSRMSHVNPRKAAPPTWMTNVYCAWCNSSIELVAVVGYEEIEFAIS